MLSHFISGTSATSITAKAKAMFDTNFVGESQRTWYKRIMIGPGICPNDVRSLYEVAALLR